MSLVHLSAFTLNVSSIYRRFAVWGRPSWKSVAKTKCRCPSSAMSATRQSSALMKSKLTSRSRVSSSSRRRATGALFAMRFRSSSGLSRGSAVGGASERLLWCVRTSSVVRQDVFGGASGRLTWRSSWPVLRNQCRRTVTPTMKWKNKIKLLKRKSNFYDIVIAWI